MDENKFEFIVCITDEQMWEECLFYIERLKIPRGYSVSVTAINHAVSMAKAYNDAMRGSNAEYKVYMHQDVFIINRNFLQDILDCFSRNPKAAMLGVLGGSGIPRDGYIYMAWNVGNVYACDGERALWNELLNGDRNVDAIDGMLIVTKQDIGWREDILDRFDFYDISQSFEFRERGYEIIVPAQNEPWCMHDCGRTKLVYYNEQRRKMIAAYPQYLESSEELDLYDAGKAQMADVVKENVASLMEQQQWETAGIVLERYESAIARDTEFETLKNILEINIAEEALAAPWQKKFRHGCDKIQELFSKYNGYKFLLRRVEYGCVEKEVEALYSAMDSGDISHIALFILTKHSIVDKRKVVSLLKEHYSSQGREECAACYGELL